MQIADLSNAQLLASLRTVVGDERRLVAQVLGYLGEVEERRIHLHLAFSSMHDFCVRHLGFSEDQACRRIAVARLGRRFPQLLDAIASGRMHLSGVHRLRELFTDANVEELITAASGKTRAELERLIAQLAPKPDVPESIQRMPEQAPLVAAGSVALVPPAAAASPSVASQLLPLSAERYRVMLTASAELHEKIEKARALLRHCNPNGDLAVILERALDLLIAQLEKEKLAKVERPRRSKGTADPADITSSTRREVFARDAGQCTFVSADGDRCPAREFLELDHRHARALGGAGDAANVRVLCRAHNHLAAEETFGREHMDRKRGRKSAKADAAATAPTATAIRRAAAAWTPRTPPREETRTPFGAAAGHAGGDPETASRAFTPAASAPSDPPPRSPRAAARFGLIGLGFRAAETDRALDRLPLSIWTSPLEDILRAALAALT